MAYQVIFSEEVFEKLNHLVFYLETNWTKKVAQNFLLTFYECIDSLAFNPKAGMQTLKDPNVRKFVITKHNTLYYQINEDKIELLTIFFNVQNPDKNKFE